MRLLYHIIGQTLFSKIDRFDFILEKDVAMMHHMIQGIPLNSSALMFQQKQEAACRVKAYLPYGMALTLVFRKYGVTLEEETNRVLMHSNTYNEWSLHHMGYYKWHDRWVWRNFE